MSYFVMPNKRHEPKPHGFVCGVKAVPELPPHPHADQIKEEKIAAMQGGAPEFIFKLDPNSKPPVTGKAKGLADGVSSPRLSNINFGEGKPDTPPKRRIRTGVSDEELRAIWAEDERKDRAAKAMMERTDMVGKMHKETYPVATRKDAPPAMRKSIHMTRPEVNECEPAGLKGVGAYCMPQHAAGRACRPQPEFEAPELPPRKPSALKKITPPDTFTLAIDPSVPVKPSRVEYGFRKS